MSLRAGTLRYPRSRVLLPRTRLAYVHLRNLFTDAKRDRSARVFGYVCVWLPDEFLLFFMQEGEIVNVTASPDGQRFHPLAVADAIAKVPREAEYGEVSFHEADDEQLAVMYWTQMREPVDWPHDLNQDNPEATFGFLHATMHDGVLEVIHEEARSYAVMRQGRVVRGFFCDDVPDGEPEDQVRTLLAPSDRWVRTRLWPVPPPLPQQAAPALIQAYRDVMANAVRRLLQSGVPGAGAVADQARRWLIPSHPALDKLVVSLDTTPTGTTAATTMGFSRAATSSLKDPIAETRALSAAVGAWLTEVLNAAPPANGTPPERFLEDLLRERRHMFQMAGLFEALPWKLFR